MAQGCAFSLGIEGDKVRLTTSYVVGDARDSLHLQKTDSFAFYPDNASSFLTLIDHVGRQVKDIIQSDRSAVPIVTGFHPSLLKKFALFFGLPHPDFKSVCDHLTALFAAKIIGKVKIMSNYGVFLPGDESKESVEADEMKDERLIYEHCIANIGEPSCLQALSKAAFDDGQSYARDSQGSQAGAGGRSQLRFALFGARHDDALYTYLNAHPRLKQDFARGLDSMRHTNIPPHHVCVKTFRDKRAPQFVDLLGTLLADEISHKNGEPLFGHVQVNV